MDLLCGVSAAKFSFQSPHWDFRIPQIVAIHDVTKLKGVRRTAGGLVA